MKKAFLYLIGFFIVGTLSGFFTYRALSVSRTVEVPSLIGDSLPEATAKLDANGLYIDVEGEDYDPVIPPGYVIRQNIPSGLMIKGFRTIGVTLSRGPVTGVMPEVTGKTLHDAEALLSEKGLKTSTLINVHSDDVDKGTVIAQDPAPFERTSQEITLIASAGPYDVIYYCPEFVGMLKDGAISLAGELELRVSLAGNGNLVRDQWPAAGTQIKPGDRVILQLEE